MPCGLLRPVLLSLLFGVATGRAYAQYGLGDLRLAAIAGPVFLANAAARPFELGLSADTTLFHARRTGLAAGALVEGGLFHPALSGTGNYCFSLDAMLAGGQAERRLARLGLRPFAVVGYTRLFNASSMAIDTANALNVGVGVDRVLNEELWLRVEVREQYTPASDSHSLVLRVGIVGLASPQ